MANMRLGSKLKAVGDICSIFVFKLLRYKEMGFYLLTVVETSQNCEILHMEPPHPAATPPSEGNVHSCFKPE